MADFSVNNPITTPDPKVTVDVSPEAPLPIGPVRFQLVVFDEDNNASEPAFLEVLIRDTKAPTAVLDGPKAVELGDSFELSAERSSDIKPGKIKSYQWTMVPILERPQ